MTDSTTPREKLVGEIVIEQASPTRRYSIVDEDGIVWIWPTSNDVASGKNVHRAPYKFGRSIPRGPEMKPHVKATFYEDRERALPLFDGINLRIEPVEPGKGEWRPEFLRGLRFTETATYEGHTTERPRPIDGEDVWEATRIIGDASEGTVPYKVCQAMARELVAAGWGPKVDEMDSPEYDGYEEDAAAPDQKILDQIKDLKTVVTDLVKYIKVPPMVLTPPDLTEDEWKDAMKNQTTLHVMDRSDPAHRGSIAISDGRVGIDLPREVFDECLRSAVIEGLVATGGGSEASNSSLFAPIYGEVCDEVVKAFAAAHFETKGQ